MRDRRFSPWPSIDTRPFTPGEREAVEVLQEFSTAAGCSPESLARAWPWRRPEPVVLTGEAEAETEVPS
jgi:aryl-alcohol dehydrogenase-like predicted oxidoreductase